jgi:hypothetical protein
MSRPSEVVASAPRGSRFWLWNQRVTVAVLAGAWPLLLVAEAVGLVESDPAVGWLGQLLGITVFAWVTYWIGFAFTLRLELTRSGQVRWFGAFRQGSIDVCDIDRISTDAAPLLWSAGPTPCGQGWLGRPTRLRSPSVVGPVLAQDAGITLGANQPSSPTWPGAGVRWRPGAATVDVYELLLVAMIRHASSPRQRGGHRASSSPVSCRARRARHEPWSDTCASPQRCSAPISSGSSLV